MNKLNLTHNQDHVLILNKNEYSIIQQALIDRSRDLNNRHSDIVAVLQTDTLSEQEHNEKVHLLTLLEDDLNTLKELIFYKS